MVSESLLTCAAGRQGYCATTRTPDMGQPAEDEASVFQYTSSLSIALEQNRQTTFLCLPKHATMNLPSVTFALKQRSGLVIHVHFKAVDVK